MNRLGRILGRIRCWSPSIALAVFALVVAACGGATAASIAPAPSGTVAVEATEYKFAPATLTAHAGNVIIRVRNAGTVDHEFEVFQGDTVVTKLDAISPGAARDLTVTLAAGTYTFVCKLSGHDQLGMKGTLTVSP